MKPLPVNAAFSKLENYPQQIVDGKISWEWIEKACIPLIKVKF